ncbi:hypothetical protein [Salinisphaera aquimarina]|uniref:Uncharacterized protein n=1 Tax=Salinisphaera aquimarina TaxID=2094031 RepID=A0ABV7ES40_9GAMM
MTSAKTAGARSALAYLALATGVIGIVPLAQWVGAPAAIVAVALAWATLKPIPRVLISLVLIVAGLGLLLNPVILGPSSATLTRLASLIIAVMLLAHVLGRSRHLALISEHLFAGRALTRYLSITFGGLFLAVPLNFGSVSVIGTLIGREIRTHGDSSGTRNAARAVLRGFGSASICSPLSIAVVLTLTLVPGLHGWQLISLTFPLAAAYLLLGTLFREPEAASSERGDQLAGADVLRSWLFFAACIGLICLSTYLLRSLVNMDYARAVTCSCLVIVVIGLFGGEGPPRLPAMDNIGNELAIIGGSAFLGATVSTLVSAHLGTSFALPGWSLPVIAWGVPWLLFGGGLIGLNPIIAVTLIGGLSSQLWPASAGLGLAVGLVCGWGLTIAGTPYSANALLIQRLTGYDNWRVSVQWSGRLSLCALALASSLAALLTTLLMP